MQNVRFNLPTNEYIEGGVLNDEFRKIDENFQIKKEFVCITSQTLQLTPNIVVLKNDYGIDLKAFRIGVGDYNYVFSQPVLITGKTVPIKEVLFDEDGNKITLELVSTTIYNIKTVNSSDEPTDGILTNQYLSFETYR